MVTADLRIRVWSDQASGTMVREVVRPLPSRVNYKLYKYLGAGLSEACVQLVIETEVCGFPQVP